MWGWALFSALCAVGWFVQARRTDQWRALSSAWEGSARRWRAIAGTLDGQADYWRSVATTKRAAHG